MKLTTKVLATAAILGLAVTSAQADTIGVAGVTGQVATLDWNPGNALVKGGIPLDANDIKPFTLYFQASLGNFLGTNGLPILANSGLNSSYEVTLIGAFGEMPKPSSATDSSFALDPLKPNFFKMYYDTTPNADNLAGTGFNDGLLVMAGYVSRASGSFSVDSVDPTAPFENLDQFGNDDWSGTQSVAGAGGTRATVKVDAYNQDFAFFSTPPSNFLVDLFFNTSNILPYQQVDPSRLFTDVDGNLFAPSIGAINGVSGPDMLFQADANSSPKVVTPEPSTMVLLGAGLFGLSVFARRRNQK